MKKISLIVLFAFAALVAFSQSDNPSYFQGTSFLKILRQPGGDYYLRAGADKTLPFSNGTTLSFRGIVAADIPVGVAGIYGGDGTAVADLDVTIPAGDSINFGNLFWLNKTTNSVGIKTPAIAGVGLTIKSLTEGIRIVGTGTTGDASTSFITFYDSNGSTARGNIGDTGGSDDNIYVTSLTGDVNIGTIGSPQMLSVTATGAGVGVIAPTVKLHVIGTDNTEGQFRVGFDAANYLKVNVADDGDVTITPTGDDLTIVGNVNLSSKRLTSVSNYDGKTYYPTIEMVSGTDTILNVYASHYSRNDSIVTVHGKCKIGWESGTSITAFTITLPVASAFTDDHNDGSGTVNISQTEQGVELISPTQARISAENVSDKMIVNVVPMGSTTAGFFRRNYFSWSFSYKVQ